MEVGEGGWEWGMREGWRKDGGRMGKDRGTEEGLGWEKRVIRKEGDGPKWMCCGGRGGRWHGGWGKDGGRIGKDGGTEGCLGWGKER